MTTPESRAVGGKFDFVKSEAYLNADGSAYTPQYVDIENETRVGHFELLDDDLDFVTKTGALPEVRRRLLTARVLAGKTLEGPTPFARNVVMAQPVGWGSPTITSFGCAQVMSSAVARTFATTNILTRAKRVGVISPATAAATCGMKPSQAGLTIGNGAGIGGFFFVQRFGISDAAPVSGARMLVGVSPPPLVHHYTR